MKKGIAVLLAALIIIGLIPAMVTAADIGVSVDGEKVVFPDQEPYIDSHNRVLVPLRGVFDKMGATVDWEASSKTVTAIKGDITVVLKTGEKTTLVNGETKTFDTEAVIKNGRTMVPLRFVSESLGATVDWIGSYKEVIITIGEGEALVPDVPTGDPDDLISQARPFDGELVNLDDYQIHDSYKEDLEGTYVESVSVNDFGPNGVRLTDTTVIHGVSVTPDAVTMTLTNTEGIFPEIYLIEGGDIIRYHAGTGSIDSTTEVCTRYAKDIYGTEFGTTNLLPEPDLKDFPYIFLGFSGDNIFKITNPLYGR